jgi:hypothetical protein
VKLSAHGLSLELPRGFEGRIYLRETPEAEHQVEHQVEDVAVGTLSRRRLVHPGRVGWAPEQPHPVVHLANFALPAGRGDFGTGAVEIMSANHVFISVLEFGAAEAGTALFAHEGTPLPSPAEFSGNALQRRLSGQAGWQRFFTNNGRPFCAYVVLGSARNVSALCAQARSVLSALTVESLTVESQL